MRNHIWAECHDNPANRICCHCGARGHPGEECEVLQLEGLFAVDSYYRAITAVIDTSKLSVERLQASFIHIRFGPADDMITLFRVEERYGNGLDIPDYVKCHATLRVFMRDRIARMFRRLYIDVPDLDDCGNCVGWDRAGGPTLPSQDPISREPALEVYKQLLRTLHQKLPDTGMCLIAWRGARFMKWGKDGCPMSHGSWTPVESDALALWRQCCELFPGQCLFYSISPAPCFR